MYTMVEYGFINGCILMHKMVVYGFKNSFI